METGRDERGRFVKGVWKGGPGRPPGSVERSYAEAFKLGCPADRLEAIVKVVASQALAGDRKAAALIMKHALPVSLAIELGRLGESEYRVAGLRPDELDAQMLERLMQKIQERREYEKSLREPNPIRNPVGTLRITDNNGTSRE